MLLPKALRPALALLALLGQAAAAFETTLSITAEMGTSLAAEQFPAGFPLGRERVVVTEPILSFTSPERMAVQVRFQAYDHRPEDNIAISETGSARFSGEPDWDPETRQVLLHNPRLDSLAFDRDNSHTQRIHKAMLAAWQARVGNPMRTPLPPHPYIEPFRNNIRDITYDGRQVLLTIAYE